uniref:Uncharacterized protein n=1 Tax=Lutzomyia longipalpis TaxID=7200 RepID=A0A1B0CQH3_LUTLO
MRERKLKNLLDSLHVKEIKGALCGSTVSILVVVMLIVGGQYKKPDPMLPLRTDGSLKLL